MAKEEYLTLNQLSTIFEASATTIRRRVKEGVLTPRKKTRRGYLFAKSDIDKLKKRDVVRKFNLPAGYRRQLSPPTKRELEFLEKYILEGNRKRTARSLGISRQRLAQKAASIAYRKVYFETIKGGEKINE